MKAKSYVEWTNEDVTEHTNQRYDHLIQCLLDDGIIDKELAEKISKYRCITVERNIFGKLFDKYVFGKKDTQWTYVIQNMR